MFGIGAMERSINVETAFRYLRRFEGHLSMTCGGMIFRLLNKNGRPKARIQGTFDEIAELHKRLDALLAEWKEETDAKS